jgi:hypothetical protein
MGTRGVVSFNTCPSCGSRGGGGALLRERWLGGGGYFPYIEGSVPISTVGKRGEGGGVGLIPEVEGRAVC